MWQLLPRRICVCVLVCVTYSVAVTSLATTRAWPCVQPIEFETELNNKRMEIKQSLAEHDIHSALSLFQVSQFTEVNNENLPASALLPCCKECVLYTASRL